MWEQAMPGCCLDVGAGTAWLLPRCASRQCLAAAQMFRELPGQVTRHCLHVLARDGDGGGKINGINGGNGINGEHGGHEVYGADGINGGDAGEGGDGRNAGDRRDGWDRRNEGNGDGNNGDDAEEGKQVKNNGKVLVWNGKENHVLLKTVSSSPVAEV
ncbi:hypothetical protein FHG87_013283 [Trinorchestia longiramus]|nr:hypothetical protein FHG87_013283 [Trinorchestia longiramus]